MCQRVGVSSDGFYGGLREDVNLYTAPNESVLNLHTLDNAEGGIIPNDCRMDADCERQSLCSKAQVAPQTLMEDNVMC